MFENSKLEAICALLHIENTSEMYQLLVDALARQIQEAHGYPSYLNCISTRVLSELISVLTGINLTTANFSAYRRKNLNLVSDISQKLNLPEADQIKCTILRDSSGKLVFQPPTDAPSKAFELALIRGGEVLRDVLYKHWRERSIFEVGHRKNWPAPSLITALRKFNLTLPIYASHNIPVRLARLFKLANKIIGANGKGITQADFEEQIFSFCREDIGSINCNATPWIPKIKGIPPVDYVNKFTSDFRQCPYFYIKSVGKEAKVGSADRTISRVQAGDVGVIITLSSRPEVGAARSLEALVKLELRRLEIFPIAGKLDHYALTVQELTCIALVIIAKSYTSKSIIHRIRASLVIS